MNQPNQGPPTPQPIPVKGGSGATVAIVIGGVVLSLVFVVGVLAAIAIPNFMKYQCRAKQSEAKSQLKSAYVAAEAFRAEYDRYPKTLAEAEWTPHPTEVVRYEYRVVEGGGEQLLLEARGVGEMAGDRWTLQQDLRMDHPESVCD